MRRFILAGSPLVIFLGIAWAAADVLCRESGQGYSPAVLPFALIGQVHPALTLPPVGGFPVPAPADDDLRGQVVVVNIFAS
ncbi:hypothetical protein [Rhizobium sp. F40D2]|uniref:hypothetical protein n=1 Tax=Rhizobium sp. F40D2 TaxID=3453141 RepID=UPI003F27138E